MHQLPSVVGIRMPAGLTYQDITSGSDKPRPMSTLVLPCMWKIYLKKKNIFRSNQVTYRGWFFKLSILFFWVASICTKICCAGCFYSNFYPLDFNSYRCKTFLQRSDNSCEALRSIAVTPYVPICQGRAFPTMIFFQFSPEPGPPLFAVKVILAMPTCPSILSKHPLLLVSE